MSRCWRCCASTGGWGDAIWRQVRGALVSRRRSCPPFTDAGAIDGNMREMPLTGHCVCGGVRFAISEPLVSSSWCHCTRCQRRTGTDASAGALVAPGSFRITDGEELVTEWTPPDSGFIKAFCSVCGGHLYSRSQDDPDRLSVRLGAVDGDPGIRPAVPPVHGERRGLGAAAGRRASTVRSPPSVTGAVRARPARDRATRTCNRRVRRAPAAHRRLRRRSRRSPSRSRRRSWS